MHLINNGKGRKKKNCSLYLLMSLFLFTFFLSATQAQETSPAAGGNANGSNGSVSYSIGQTFYLTNTGTNGSVAEGVQQPYEISIIIGIKEAEGINLQCSVYPNPTSDFLILKTENYSQTDLSYQLFNTQGKLIENKKIGSNETSISMTHCITGTYYLKIIQYKQEIKIFKIVKM